MTVSERKRISALREALQAIEKYCDDKCQCSHIDGCECDLGEISFLSSDAIGADDDAHGAEAEPCSD